MKKRIIGLLVLVLGILINIPDVFAGNLSVWSNSNTVVRGSTVTITVKADGLAGKFVITSSNGNVLSGGSNGEWIENATKTFQFRANNTGQAVITVRPDNVADSDCNKYTASKSITINVVNPRQKSTNNNLKNLKVDDYQISPEFNKDTLDYTVTVESNVEKVTIYADKEDGYANVDGIGEKEVIEGDNKFEVVVTSETGSKKTYTVNIVVTDSNPITKVIDGNNYTVVKRASSLVKPELFEETTVRMNDIDIPAFYHETTNITLVGLRDQYGDIYLYRYDSKNDSYQKFEVLTSLSKTVIFEDTNEVIEGFEKKTITIVNSEYTVYQNKINNAYSLIYGMDLETGTKGWYLFNNQEQTIQTYMGDVVDSMKSDFNKTLDEYKIVILGMIGLSLLLLIIIIIQITTKAKLKKKVLKASKMQLSDTKQNIILEDRTDNNQRK